MIKRAQLYFSSISPAFIDGLLYVLIALFGCMIASFTADEAYEYINAYLLYWLTETSKWGLGVATALKMFRSTSYAEHRENKSDEAEARRSAPGPVP